MEVIIDWLPHYVDNENHDIVMQGQGGSIKYLSESIAVEHAKAILDRLGLSHDVQDRTRSLPFVRMIKEATIVRKNKEEEFIVGFIPKGFCLVYQKVEFDTQKTIGLSYLKELYIFQKEDVELVKE